MENHKVTVLVLEEHPLMRESLCAAIAAETDLKVLEPARDALNAFRFTVSSQHDVLFLSAKPDIILLSLGNPGLEDLLALARLRITLPEIPILALTRAEVPGQEQAALQYGAQTVLTKSVTRDELLSALRTIKEGVGSVNQGQL